MTLIAAAVPFDYLDSLISAGILVAFPISDSCVVLMRQESPADKPFLL
jgi:APA family basic amino acid/polyamine antiporter